MLHALSFLIPSHACCEVRAGAQCVLLSKEECACAAHPWLGGSYLLTSTSTTLHPALCRCRHMCSPFVLLAPVSGHRNQWPSQHYARATISNLKDAFHARLARLPELLAVCAYVSGNSFSAGCLRSIPAKPSPCCKIARTLQTALLRTKRHSLPMQATPQSCGISEDMQQCGRESPLTMAVPRTSPVRRPMPAMRRFQTCLLPSLRCSSSARSATMLATTMAHDTATAAQEALCTCLTSSGDLDPML